MKTYRLPVFDIVVTTDGKGSGSINSSLKEDNPHPVQPKLEGDETMHAEFDAAMDGIESLVLACACNGIDITRSEFVQAIESAVESCENHLL
jgi:hypothetical protein